MHPSHRFIIEKVLFLIVISQGRLDLLVLLGNLLELFPLSSVCARSDSPGWLAVAECRTLLFLMRLPGQVILFEIKTVISSHVSI